MKTRLSAIILVIFCTIFTATGQILWKLGVKNLELSFLGLITNYPLILGFVSYGVGTVLLVVALKYGELSVLYPFIALSFIWVGFMSVAFLGEVMTFFKWMAILLIIGGVSLISFKSDKHG